MKFTLELTQAELDFIMKSLMTQPWASANPLINNILNQLKPQVTNEAVSNPSS